VVVDVIGPFVLEEEEGTKDEGRDEDGQQGDADEAPEVKQALLEKSSEARGSVSKVAEESSGDEEEVDDEKERDGCMTGDSGCISDGAFVKMKEDFADGAEVEAAGEALGCERVVQERGELTVDADREEKRKGEIEDVGPEKRGEAAQGKREAVEEDVAAFNHDRWNL
jgi:hypothetical protein